MYSQLLKSTCSIQSLSCISDYRSVDIHDQEQKSETKRRVKMSNDQHCKKLVL